MGMRQIGWDWFAYSPLFSVSKQASLGNPGRVCDDLILFLGMILLDIGTVRRSCLVYDRWRAPQAKIGLITLDNGAQGWCDLPYSYSFYSRCSVNICKWSWNSHADLWYHNQYDWRDPSNRAESEALFWKFNVLVKLFTSGINLALYPPTKPFPSPFFPSSWRLPDFESTLGHQNSRAVSPGPH